MSWPGEERWPKGLREEADKIRNQSLDPEISKDGVTILVTHLPAVMMGRWVRAFAAMSGQKIDWCYFGGRAVIQTTSKADMEQIEWALKFMRPALDAMNADEDAAWKALRPT